MNIDVISLNPSSLKEAKFQKLNSCLLEAKFYLKFSKCHFLRTSIEYLGHIISPKGVAPDPCKIEPMVKWPTPTTLKQLRGFLGLTGFYRCFIKNYASLSFHLAELLKKDTFLGM